MQLFYTQVKDLLGIDDKQTYRTHPDTITRECTYDVQVEFVYLYLDLFVVLIKIQQKLDLFKTSCCTEPNEKQIPCNEFLKIFFIVCIFFFSFYQDNFENKVLFLLLTRVRFSYLTGAL